MTQDARQATRSEGAKAELTRRRAELTACVPSDDGPAARPDAFGLELGRRHARILDEMVVSLHRRVIEAAGAASAPARPRGLPVLALAGVGAYGRGAVALRSDLDVRLLVADVSAAGSFAESLLYPLWDMGVPVGHQVVTADDLLDAAQVDLPTATSLLDWRHVAGDRELSGSLRRRAEAGIFAHSELPRFMRRLEEEVAQRHGRFGGSVYLLEPDVKNGAGGLRDLDVARWAAQARYGISELDDLIRVGALLPREAVEQKAAAEMLWRIRNALHAHAGRRSDRLAFDEQESLAVLLGYGRGGDAVEQMMSTYYRNARNVTRMLDTILARATPHLTRRRPRDEDLGSGVRLFDGTITFSDPEMLRTDPALALRLVSAAVDRGAPLLPYARDAIARATGDPSWCEHLRRSPEAARRFRELVATCKDTALRSGSIVRELHDLGLLLAMIPEFSPVVGRVHHDVYHVFTVDVHSVSAVDRLALLVRGELAAELPLPCRLAAEIARPEMLFFATLLHDVGKAIGGTDHGQRGAEMARGILARLGLPPEDIAEACHPVRKHLLLYHVATRRDLDDPATMAELLREVHGREGLRDLYLLTVADLSTTSPTSMTEWKARMLDELYLAADAALGERLDGVEVGARAEGGRAAAGPRSGGDDARIARAAAEAEHEVLALPARDDDERAARRAFLDLYLASMPDRYLLANAPAAIAAHAELARSHDGHTAAISIVPSRHGDVAELCVVAPDRPGLLAAIAAAFAASRLEVHAAQIHSRLVDGEGGPVQAVDLFWVRDRGEGAPGVARAVPKLVRDVNAVLAGELSPAELSRSRGSRSYRERPSPRVRTQVSVDDRASQRHTVIEVLTRDRPGLLFAIADCLYRLGLTIVVAKVNTEGMRVADVFYVSEADGSKIAPGKRTAEVQSGILAALEGLEQEGSSG